MEIPTDKISWLNSPTDLYTANRKEKQENTMVKKMTKIVLKGIALAMGAIVIVMSTLKFLDVISAISMLAFGLTALSLASLQE